MIEGEPEEEDLLYCRRMQSRGRTFAPLKFPAVKQDLRKLTDSQCIVLLADVSAVCAGCDGGRSCSAVRGMG
jgi:hypothetical protein